MDAALQVRATNVARKSALYAALANGRCTLQLADRRASQEKTPAGQEPAGVFELVGDTWIEHVTPAV
jgi:hypothetical protein